jgi:flagella basal body P-ring formation protein FlgA
MKTNYDNYRINCLKYCRVPAVTILAVICSSVCARIQMTVDFKDTILVNDTTFTLSEIATITGNDATALETLKNTVAGVSAPPSYSRFIAVNDLVARLRSKYVQMDLTSNGALRPLIKTDFREIKIGEFTTDITAYLDSIIGWKSGEWSVAFQNLSESVKILNRPFTASITGLELQRFSKGPTSLNLQIGQGSRAYHSTIRCMVTVKLPVYTALHDIRRGQMISTDDYEVRTVDITRFAPIPVTSAAMLTGKCAARSIRQGTILHDRLLKAVPVIEKGDLVAIRHNSKGITISVTGTAREQGGTGDRIWVENGATHKLIRVEIIEKGKVALVTGDVQI